MPRRGAVLSAPHRRARTVLVGVVLVVVASAVLVARTSSSSASDHPPRAPRHLTVDDDAAPLAVEGPPRFGWEGVDDDRGEVQRAYELVVTTAPHRGAACEWDSGRVPSAEQSYVVARGLHTLSDHTYYWTVRTWDRSNRAGPWAPFARFDTGINDADWHADRIRRPGIDPQAADDFTLLRTERTLGRSEIVRAVAYVSAGQQYDLRVNGSRVAHGPSFAYPTTSTTRRPTSRVRCIPVRRTCSPRSRTGRRQGKDARRRCPRPSPASPSCTPTARPRSSRLTAPGASVPGCGSPEHCATARVTTSSTSTRAANRSAGTRPASTTTAGRTRSWSAHTRPRRSSTCAPHAPASSSTPSRRQG